MKEKIINFFTKNNRKKITISCLLIALWVFLTVVYIITFDTSFSVLSYNHRASDFTQLTYKKLYENDSVSGDFTARDNNLGIVSIRFQTYIRPPYIYEDNFLFKIKEKGAKDWYYENVYRSGLIYDVPFFPFGFPQIPNSKGKEYQFELTSLGGNATNAISIRNWYPILETKYKYSGRELIHNPRKLVSFFAQKTYNAFQVPDVWFSSLIYLLPFLFYLLWISSWGRRIDTRLKPITDPIRSSLSRSRMDIIILLVASVDIFIIQLTNDIIYLIIIPLWIATLTRYKFHSKYSFGVGIVFISLSPLFLLIKNEPISEKLAVWAYIFFVAGIIQLLYESKNSK